MLSVGLPETRALASAVDTCPVRAATFRSDVDEESELRGKAVLAGPGWKEVAVFQKKVFCAARPSVDRDPIGPRTATGSVERS